MNEMDKTLKEEIVSLENAGAEELARAIAEVLDASAEKAAKQKVRAKMNDKNLFIVLPSFLGKN